MHPMDLQIRRDKFPWTWQLDQLADTIKMDPNLRRVQPSSAQPGVGQSLLAPNVVPSQGPLTLDCTASFGNLGISLAGAAFHRQLSMLMAAASHILTFKVYCMCYIRWNFFCSLYYASAWRWPTFLSRSYWCWSKNHNRLDESIVGIFLAKVHTVALWPMPCFQLSPQFLGAGNRSHRMWGLVLKPKTSGRPFTAFQMSRQVSSQKRKGQVGIS